MSRSRPKRPSPPTEAQKQAWREAAEIRSAEEAEARAADRTARRAERSARIAELDADMEARPGLEAANQARAARREKREGRRGEIAALRDQRRFAAAVQAAVDKHTPAIVAEAVKQALAAAERRASQLKG